MEYFSNSLTCKQIEELPLDKRLEGATEHINRILWDYAGEGVPREVRLKVINTVSELIFEYMKHEFFSRATRADYVEFTDALGETNETTLSQREINTLNRAGFNPETIANRRSWKSYKDAIALNMIKPNISQKLIAKIDAMHAQQGTPGAAGVRER